MCISTSQVSLHAETISDTESFDCRHYGIIVQSSLAKQTPHLFFIFSPFLADVSKDHILSAHIDCGDCSEHA